MLQSPEPDLSPTPRFSPLRNHNDVAVTPVIETERLTLRGHMVEDFGECAAMWGDPEVTRFIGPPSTPADTWARIRGYVGQWALLGYGYWLVEERKTARLVGEVGFGEFLRDITPSLAGRPEIGWVLATDAQGKGYATEAVRAALAWADAHFRAGQKTACIIAPDNAASLRVAGKCGYREIARTTYKDGPTIVMER